MTLQEIAEQVVNRGVEVAVGTERGASIYRTYQGYVYGPVALSRILKHFGIACKCKRRDPMLLAFMAEIRNAESVKAKALNRAPQYVFGNRGEVK